MNEWTSTSGEFTVSDKPSDEPWYRNGLKFACTQCGDCCTGAPGFVWVNKAEIGALASNVGMDDIDEFEKKYVRKIGVRKSLVEFPNGDCVFFDGATRRCTVYQARPRQCRTWPFWSSNLRSPRAWEATCAVCPGSGQGKLHELASIEEMRKTVRV
jgi:Fe-S-cluster containining protein